MGYHNHCRATVSQGEYTLHHCAGAVRVQIAGGLVAEKDFRLCHQCSCHSHPLLLAAGQLMGAAVYFIPQAHFLQPSYGPAAAVEIFPPAVFQRQGHIFKSGHTAYQIVALEYKAYVLPAHPGQLFIWNIIDFFAGKIKPAAVKTVQPAESIQQGGFAAARWPGNHTQAAALHTQVYI